jgi:hypothetical protein
MVTLAVLLLFLLETCHIRPLSGFASDIVEYNLTEEVSESGWQKSAV